MATRSSKKWKAKRPGGWDVLNVDKGIFPSSNKWGIPDLLYSFLEIPSSVKLSPFHLKTKGAAEICHFFLDDYRFERVWSRPSVYINMLKQYYAVLTPDFSLYTDYPSTLNLYNTYRSRWLGRYWQEQGIRVIPTVGWAGTDSYEYCFSGVQKGSAIAISPPDLRKFKDGFYSGLQEAIRVIEPKAILSYGIFDVSKINFTREIIFFEKNYYRGGYQ